MVDETERVSMQWPKELKEQVRDKVGARGLTEFTLDAVHAHLNGGAEREQVLGKEINELKWLVQQLADRVAMGGEIEDRQAALMEIELPEWIDTSGWPDSFAALVKPVAAVPTQTKCDKHPGYFIAAGSSECPECRRERRAQEAESKDGPAPIAPGEEVVISGTSKMTKEPDGDMLARVLAKAREKGVELAEIGLKPASEVKQPAPKPAVSEEKAQEAIVVMEEEVAEIATVPKCPKCGDELVDSECWTCDL